MYLITITMVIIAVVVAIDHHFQIVKLKPLLATSAVFLMTTLVLTGCSEEKTSSTDSRTGKTEQISKKEYDQAKKEHQQLVATNKQLDKELSDTDQQRKQLEQKVDAQEDSAADEVKAEQMQDQASDQQPAANNNTNDSNDDMIQGGNSQYIIGNVNSHVYHMPGQRGYSMKSKNAVYFSSEQEAINAGYRKAKQ